MNSPPVFLPPDLVSDVETFAAPGDLWHRPKAVFEPIWKRVTGKVNLAILDTGYTPHDLLPEPIYSKSFIRGESIRDGNGHGNHCAGIALGREGLGVAPGASLMVIKVLSNDGVGSSDGIANGVRDAVDNGADILSLSLGSSSPYEPTREALKYAWSKGVITLCAAGNSGFDGRRNTIGYPAKYHEEALAVGAYRKDGQRSTFSSGGRELDICCPGQDVWSCSTTNGFRSMSGTSMATPDAAGLFCLIVDLMRSEGAASFTSADAVREFLKRYTQDKGDPGFDPFWGLGIPKTSDIVAALVNDQLTFV